MSLGLLVIGLACAGSNTTRTNATREPRHYVFFAHERGRITEPSFLDNPGAVGAQLKYSWRELEPERDCYDFAALLSDLEFLAAHDKRLFIQLQDVSFDPTVLVPEYLIEEPVFGGGVAAKYESRGDDDSAAQFDGYVARRWDPSVRERFAKLLTALGERFDGRIEGINLAETSIDFGVTGRFRPPGFTPEGYVEAVTATMTAARAAFSRSHVIQYANFMPGEWLPDDDQGFLRSVHSHAAAIGVGVGGPDLMPYRKGQKNHSYPLIAARPGSVVAGIAVQDGNLAELDPQTGVPITVAELVRFATDELRLDYLFWGTEEPYYSSVVLPYLRTFASGSTFSTATRPHVFRPTIIRRVAHRARNKPAATTACARGA